MNSYPVWWDRTVTVYNKYEDKQTQLITWHRHTLSDCFWKYVGEKVSVGSTVLETNNIICRIPKNDNFLEKYKWINIPTNEMDRYFTISAGDIIVNGEVDDDINEYQSGKRSTDILAKYKELQGCMVVEDFAINVGSGRCNEHYYVRGL